MITIISTFLLTRYLAPAVQGEVNLAFVLVGTAGAATTIGVSQFVAAHPKEGRTAAFHGSVIVLLLGVVACLASVAAAGPVAGWLNTPGMVQYVPGMALAHYLDRAGWVPRAILVREMRFREAGLRTGLGEIAFAISGVAFAHAGWGGNAIVGANLVRGVVGLVFVAVVTDWRDYLLPCRLTLETMGRIFRFGMPITIAGLFAVGAMSWDNSFMGYRFGEATVGIYNQAYRLADLPATSVGDQINDVLVPAFARATDAESRRRGFLRAASLMGMVVFPMALGLGAIAPTMVEVFYPKSYAGVAPFLVVLATLSIARSLGNLAGAFLQVVGRTSSFILIDAILVATVLGFMALLAPFGAVWSAVGVAVAYFLMLVLTLNVLRPDGIPLRASLAAVWRPFLACVPMVATVVAVRYGLSTLGLPGVLRLCLELACGVGAYVGAAFLIAPKIARDLIDLGKSAVRRKRKAPPEAEPAEATDEGVVAEVAVAAPPAPPAPPRAPDGEA